ncbi:MAG TPA: hypothetical protein VLF79_01960 [Candidatus Saccharimonadales bacterium]|nr:hypothetical protein [Candidatus Saccharimonadales bacterium]
MSSKRLYFVQLGLIGLLFIGLLGGAYTANKLLTGRATVLTDSKAKKQALNQQQQTLLKDKKDIKKYTSLEKIAKEVVPQDKDQAEAVQEIVNIASKNGISLKSITFPQSTLGTDTPGSSGSGSTSSSSGSSSSAAAPSKASSAKASALSQLVPVKGLSGVYQLNIAINSDPDQFIRYSQLISFLSDLEHDRRTAQVESLNLTPQGPNKLTFVISLNEYIKP